MTNQKKKRKKPDQTQAILGGKGESNLTLWLSEVGASFNKAVIDKTAWDYLVEFPEVDRPNDKQSDPIDKDLLPLSVYIQVKATNKRDGSIQVALSNWKRLVLNPFPTFFVVFGYDFQVKCQRAFLVHVDKNYIEKFIKRLRETNTSKRNNLHEMSMQFTYGSDNEIPSLDGMALKEAIQKHIGEDMYAYAKDKMEFVRSVGYNDDDIIMELDVILPEIYDSNRQEYLVDLSIGLITELKFGPGVVKDIRFGITASKPLQTFEEARLSLPRLKPAGSAIIRLRNSAGDELRVATDIYIPRGINNITLEDKNFKIRLKNQFIDMIFWINDPSKGDFRFTTPDTSKEYSIKDLRDISKFVLFISTFGQNAIEFEVLLQSKVVGEGRIEPGAVISEDIIRYMSAINSAVEIAKYFDADDVIVKPSELLRQKDQLALMHLSIYPRKDALNIPVTLDDINDLDNEHFIPIVSHVVIGQYRMIIAGVFIGRVVKSNEQIDGLDVYRFEALQAEIRKRYLYDRTETPKQTVQGLRDDITEYFQKTMTVIKLSSKDE